MEEGNESFHTQRPPVQGSASCFSIPRHAQAWVSHPSLHLDGASWERSKQETQPINIRQCLQSSSLGDSDVPGNLVFWGRLPVHLQAVQ